MNNYLLLLISLIAIFAILKLKTSRIIYLKSYFLPIISIVFILCLIFLSETAISSALKGIKLWLDIVFPSLFPFFVASEILSSTGFVRLAGVLMEPIMRPLFNVPGCGSFAFAMGITSGYPVGAKITAGMLENKHLTKIEAERLLAFTNNSGPLFIIGAVATGMFKLPVLGLFLLSCHIAACISVGILFKFYGRKIKGNKCKIKASTFSKFKSELRSLTYKTNSNLGSILGEAVKNSVMTLLTIGGFIILFSVIINFLLEIGLIDGFSGLISNFLSPFSISKEIISSVLCGIFEITTGTNMASTAQGASLLQKLTIVSFILGWAGLSVHSQVISIVSRTGISIKPYLVGKFLQGCISAFYAFIGFKIAGSALLNAKPAFLSLFTTSNTLYWFDYVMISLKYLLFSLALIILLGVFSFLYSRIKHSFKQYEKP